MLLRLLLLLLRRTADVRAGGQALGLIPACVANMTLEALAYVTARVTDGPVTDGVILPKHLGTAI
jgi:hypothetical protein